MKKLTTILLSLLLLVTMLLTACADEVQDVIDNNTKTPLAVPTNVRVDEDTATLMWNSVEYASGYTVMVNETTYTTSTNSFSLQALRNGEYTISVKANGDGTMYTSSAYSDTISYTRITDSGNEYEDDVVAAFREFDEINTKNSFLGYGIDIINASAITSKNVLMTYPIFDMDKLMNEKLLKSNEHYNSFESIEASTIEEFSQNMSNSTSITSGQNVSAKGNIYGVDVKASAALSSGLTTSFTKTSDLVESQYFLEVIAENQSYWLVLQTSEARYKELLSEEFKSDLYNISITPAQLFEKYGTHLLTSVAMGGNICMYYTMYSYDKNVTTSQYAEISSTLKTNVEAAYGGYSAGTGTENSFSNAFTYETLAHSYGIQVDKKIVSAGGGSFGINNETTLYENYYDWQKSLDTYPVVIGIKDVNSLYPIWNLLDLNVEGAAERYNELYNYFQSYGAQSYDNLCRTYSITPSVAPTDITDINVGSHTNYSENQTVNVSSGETLRISFNVEPYNANKYLKTYSVDNDALASIDDTGLLTISPTAPGGSYIRVTITAGSISKQITLYVINTYNVNFNTRVGNLTVPPIYGILEGYTIKEPVLYREGYILEGWYTDAANTTKFDFETDSVTSNMTLFAKWVAIKPVVTFDTGDGSPVDSQTLAYNGTATKPKNPTLTGYSFGGWYTDEDHTEPFDFTTTVISDITLYAKWTKIEYTVSFVTDGGTPIAPITTSITEEYKISEPTTVKQYYSLAGWYRDAALTQRFYFESEITSDITLYAKWTPVKVTVKLVDSDGTSPLYDELGSVINSRVTDIEKDFKITVPVPVKEGYTFAGWYLNGIKIDLNEYDDFKPLEDGYTIMAKWTVNSYTVSFIIDGEEYSTEEYNFGDEIIYPEVNVEGHTFSGWKYGLKALPATMPAKNIEITGTLAVNRYNLKYYVDGNLYLTKIYSYGEAITLIDEPTEDGKKFSGWVCSSMESIPSVMPAFDVRIDGSFDQTTYYIRYYIDDILVKTQPVIKGHGIVPYAPESKEGYSFSGWLIKDGDTYAIMPEVMPATDISAYGSYTINQYTITFNTAGGTEIDAITADYGAAITKPANPTRVGYTFADWDAVIPATMPAKDMTITASWAINRYTITFNTMGGTEIDAITADYGTAITKPANPTRVGYTFAGWDAVIPATMPAKDMTITASWTINRYTITFNTMGGTEIDAITAEYGAAITKPANPTREGYTFAGWDVAIPSTMPEGNITITAGWTLNTSSITYIKNSGTTVDGHSTKGSFAINGDVTIVSYNVTQLNYAYSTTYNEYYNFLGWYTSATGGVQLTDKQGHLLANVSGYTNANGEWIRENSDSITLYAQWEKPFKYAGYTYIEDAEDFYTIFADGNALSGKYMLIDDISLDNHTPIGTYYWAHDNADKADEKAVITPFTGVLNGDGHKITYSMTFNSFVQYSNYALGLFATSDGATFEYIDLDIQLVAKGTPGHDTREVSVGGLVGMAKNTTFRGIEVLSTSRIENNETDQFWKNIFGTWCDLGATYAGGVAGDARYCKFFDCTNGGTVYAQGWTAYAGGIAGNSYNGYNTGCSNLQGSSVSAHGGEHENYGNEHSDEGVVFGKETAPWLRKDNSTVLNY